MSVLAPNKKNCICCFFRKEDIGDYQYYLSGKGMQWFYYKRDFDSLKPFQFSVYFFDDQEFESIRNNPDLKQFFDKNQLYILNYDEMIYQVTPYYNKTHSSILYYLLDYKNQQKESIKRCKIDERSSKFIRGI